MRTVLLTKDDRLSDWLGFVASTRWPEAEVVPLSDVQGSGLLGRLKAFRDLKADTVVVGATDSETNLRLATLEFLALLVPAKHRYIADLQGRSFPVKLVGRIWRDTAAMMGEYGLSYLVPVAFYVVLWPSFVPAARRMRCRRSAR